MGSLDNAITELVSRFSVIALDLGEGSTIEVDTLASNVMIHNPTQNYTECYYIMPQYLEKYCRLRAARYVVMRQMKDITSRESFRKLVNKNNTLALESMALYRAPMETFEPMRREVRRDGIHEIH